MPDKTKKTRYIAITGGVISGVGKGIITSSVATLLEAQDYSVEIIKIDPYLNFDAGLMRPTEHGEVFVTPDGFETDQDLGNYTRFTNANFSRLNSVTSGQVFLAVIERERRGEYNGKCVEIFPHIPEEVISRIYKVREKTNPDFVLIEFGGTAGEDQQKFFYEAIVTMKYNGEDVRHIHVGYAPIPGKLGEQKSKPIQQSVRALNESGLQPDFIIGRSELEIDDERKKKIAITCKVAVPHVISAPDVNLVYEVPLLLQKQNFDINLFAILNLPYKKPNAKFESWKALVNKIKNIKHIAKIAMVGKYFDSGNFILSDSYISVIESLKIAGWHNGINIQLEWINSKDIETGRYSLKNLKRFDGICVPGGFGDKGVEGIIAAIRHARTNKIPYLGLCFGLQLAVVEFARNVARLKQAHTTEINPNTSCPVIHILPEQQANIETKNMGCTQRLGDYEAELKEGTLVYNLYGKMPLIVETHRHRYEVNNELISKLKDRGIIISGINPARDLVEMIELSQKAHPFFVATQAHPEFRSRFLKPAPLFNGFVKACTSKKKGFFKSIFN